MKRRDLIKNIAISGLGLGAVQKVQAAEAPTPQTANQTADEMPDPKVPNGRTKSEAVRDERLKKEIFFNAHELKTITALCDIILPAAGASPSAVQVGVPAFIEFIVKDMPDYQTPMRGGLMWLDSQARRRAGNKFVLCPKTQQLELIDDIAYPESAKPEHRQGVAFFNLMRNLTMTGYYTTEAGFRDLGYVGNRPNNWDGVPADVLAQYGFTGNE